MQAHQPSLRRKNAETGHHAIFLIWWQRYVLIAIGCSLLGLMMSAVWQAQLTAQKVPMTWSLLVGPCLLYWNTWGAVSLFVFWASRRVAFAKLLSPWLLLLHVPLSVIVPLLTFTLYAAIYGIYLGLMNLFTTAGVPIYETLLQHFGLHYIFGPGVIGGCFTYCAVAAAAYARAYYRNYQDAELRYARLETELAQAELQALKMQIHPHFLFNTLNSISSLVQSDPAVADKMITRLGDFLRMALDSSHVSEVSLESELRFAKAYLDIEQIRFRHRLRVKIDIPSALLAAQVPNLILQPLIENAIKHGISKRVAPVEIIIRARAQDGLIELSVADTGPGLAAGLSPEAAFTKGIGLSNTRARLMQHAGATLKLEPITTGQSSGLKIIMQLPLRLSEVKSAITASDADASQPPIPAAAEITAMSDAVHSLHG